MAGLPLRLIRHLAPHDQDTARRANIPEPYAHWYWTPGQPLIPPTDPGAPPPDPWKAWWDAVRALRPDLEATNGRDLILVEVKPALTPHAIGQALCYRDLARVRRRPPGQVLAAVIYTTPHPDLEPIAAAYGLLLWPTPGQ